MKEQILCCYISPSGKKCKKEAEFTVIYGNAPNDATESCSCHIGELGDNDSGRFEVVRLNKEKEVIKEGDTVKVEAAIRGAPDEIYRVIRSSTTKELILDDVMGTALSEIRPEVIQKVEECSICHGKGSTTDHHDPCSNCGGKGYIT